MGYITARPMKIQVRPGVVELRGAGEPVPEAESWPKPDVWVRRGYIIETKDAAAPAKVVAKAEPEPEASDTESELLKMSRPDLEEFALASGVQDTDTFPNKRALVAAVLKAAGE